MQSLLKILSLAFGALFVGFATVQYNDPDFPLWIFAYAVPAYVSFAAFREKFNVELIWMILLGSLAGAFTFFPYGHYEGVALKQGMKTMEIETARESFGLAIVAFACVIYLYAAYRRRQS
ncbi:MAG: hypothetical protein KatS3mg031_2026 [Chitinophagales bacterium]|nr:MAG: hypothetical protein KatS3mg031_2026 [Chitinophagales bacterium]